MSIGISGTREGCNPAQFMELQQLLEDAFDVSGGIFMHGDCVGVDEEAHRIARRIGYEIEMFPPENPKHRAFCEGDVVHRPAPYLERNEHILLAADSMLIVPEKSMTDAPRSGAWWTYRKALELHVPTTLIIGGRFEHTDDEHYLRLRLPTLRSRGELPAAGEPEVP